MKHRTVLKLPKWNNKYNKIYNKPLFKTAIYSGVDPEIYYGGRGHMPLSDFVGNYLCMFI